jgi:hypothetical protein
MRNLSDLAFCRASSVISLSLSRARLFDIISLIPLSIGDVKWSPAHANVELATENTTNLSCSHRRRQERVNLLSKTRNFTRLLIIASSVMPLLYSTVIVIVFNC